MSTLVNWNGQQYLVPAYNDTGYAQGNGNLSQYLVALSTGSLQQVGGLFQLTADADFGPNFGLVSSYYKSRSANIASAGVLRLANTDAIKWRNSDNSADVTLAMNATGTAARTYTIPDLATSSFVMTEGTQTINGAKTFGSAIIGSLTGAASLNLLLSGGTLTGALLAAAGSAATPSVTFGTDTNTGMSAQTADTLVLSTAGAAGVSISPAGIVTQPLQPAFLVRYTNATDVTGDDTVYTMAYDTEVFDQGSNFNTGTYTFTAPITGKYLLSGIAIARQIGVAHTYMEVRIITSNRNYVVDCTLLSASTYNDASITVIADMDVNDTAYIILQVGGSTKTVDTTGGTGSFFSGSLIN